VESCVLIIVGRSRNRSLVALNGPPGHGFSEEPHGHQVPVTALRPSWSALRVGTWEDGGIFRVRRLVRVVWGRAAAATGRAKARVESQSRGRAKKYAR